MGDRPFVWVDDEVCRDDQAYFGDHQLVYRVDAGTGLTAADFAAVREWAAGKSFADKAFRPHP
ncbi:hypothetical protein EV646_10471 [Kribbella antiqua]|uniref:Uncharacterized protein n=1 Tax=Kribbella antiqua TaxID=2512217 RepID=A0A4R2ISG3_9ACTN|nr:hypothetical protein [Kribbella antiqua]TCO48254.1 hypothetical protein EV646_10471 [Kribbella antiqua]